MDNRPIGVFDSGLGGLTAVRELRRLLPRERIIYFGDTGRMPYGGRSREEILTFTAQNVDFLKSFDVKLILAACGTSSTLALPALKDTFGLPVFGVIEPASGDAARVTRNNRIGVMATAATITGGAFHGAILDKLPDAQITDVPCPLLAPLIEAGHVDAGDPALDAALEAYLTPIREAGADTLLLGCTHYPLISRAIAEKAGEHVSLVGAGESAARQLFRSLSPELRAEKREGGVTYFTSGDAAVFKDTAERILGRALEGEIRHIEPFGES